MSTSSRTQSWSLDALGNWSSVTSDGTTQTRTHDSQNEVTAVSGATSPLFDASGNTTRDETNKSYTYDAWNHVVAVTVSAKAYGYAYDALGRRIIEGSHHGDISPGPADTDLYYSAQWQVLQEVTAKDNGDGSTTTTTVQNVWSPAYVDALVLRDVSIDTTGGLGPQFGGNGIDSLDFGIQRPIPTVTGRLYVQQDANWNVTAITNTSGTVQERFIYDPYGKVSYRNADWTASTSGDAYTLDYLHQGGRFDQVTGLYYFRNRDYSPTLGRWMEQDPAGYIDGANLYGYEGSEAASAQDPTGLHYVPPDQQKLAEAQQIESQIKIYKMRMATGMMDWAYGQDMIASLQQKLAALFPDAGAGDPYGPQTMAYGATGDAAGATTRHHQPGWDSPAAVAARDAAARAANEAAGYKARPPRQDPSRDRGICTASPNTNQGNNIYDQDLARALKAEGTFRNEARLQAQEHASDTRDMFLTQTAAMMIPVFVRFARGSDGATHGSRHVPAGTSASDVEAAIAADINSKGCESTGLGKGTVTVGGTVYEYHTYPLPGGGTNVGTYHPI